MISRDAPGHPSVMRRCRREDGLDGVLMTEDPEVAAGLEADVPGAEQHAALGDVRVEESEYGGYTFVDALFARKLQGDGVPG